MRDILRDTTTHLGRHTAHPRQRLGNFRRTNTHRKSENHSLWGERRAKKLKLYEIGSLGKMISKCCEKYTYALLARGMVNSYLRAATLEDLFSNIAALCSRILQHLFKQFEGSS